MVLLLLQQCFYPALFVCIVCARGMFLINLRFHGPLPAFKVSCIRHESYLL
uniref:Uncharacterized protein n=1 Tax=Anguilla anguilla TaxID=7936 RepID=A0A0E9T2I3_ANGAN